MITKEKLREEYETETGKTHGNALFSTTDYACWLEKKIVKNCSIPGVVGQSEQLHECSHRKGKECIKPSSCSAFGCNKPM